MPPTIRFAEAFLTQEDLEYLRHGHTTERIDHISQTTLLKQIPQTLLNHSILPVFVFHHHPHH
jgi:hypothetical protein